MMMTDAVSLFFVCVCVTALHPPSVLFFLKLKNIAITCDIKSKK
jgi:hypothetical protein